MRRLLVMVICFIVVVSLIDGFTYVGAIKCKMCHVSAKKGEVYLKWEKGPHARAFETLQAKGEGKNIKCRQCHLTVPQSTILEGVGCEACHGPGSAYRKFSIMKDRSLAIKNGLIIPTEAVCRKCHNLNCSLFKGFKYQEWKKRIDHTYRH